MISFSGWQSVDINFFKMFGSCLFKRFLIKTGNESPFLTPGILPPFTLDHYPLSFLRYTPPFFTPDIPSLAYCVFKVREAVIDF